MDLKGNIIGLTIAIAVFLAIVSSEISVAAGTITGVSLAGLIIIGYLVVYFILAPLDIIWTLVHEGTAKIITKGGAFIGAIMQWTEYHMDDEYNVVKGEAKSSLFGGLRFVGIPPKQVHKHDFKWTEVLETGEFKTYTEENLDYVPLEENTYGFAMKEVEDMNLIPLEFKFSIRMQAKNLYKCLFRVQGDWTRMVPAELMPIIRDYIGEFSEPVMVKKEERTGFDALVRMKGRLGKEIWDKLEKKRKYIRDEWGIEIKDLGVLSINPPDWYRDQTLKERTAEYDRRKKLIDADAEKKRIEIVTGAIQSFGDTGTIIRLAEAMEKSPLAATYTTTNIPGLSEFLSKSLGKTPPESITKKEFEELKQIVKEALEK